MHRVEPANVDVSGTLGRQRGGLAFQHLPKFKQVPVQQGMALEHVLPGVNKVCLQPVRYMGSTAVARAQQAFGHQFLNRLPQRRPRNAQIQRECALGWQPVARLE